MHTAALAATLLSIVPVAGSAQDFSFVGDQAINMGSATLTQVMDNNIMDPRLRRGSIAQRQVQQAGPPAGSARVSLIYVPSVAVRRQVEGEIVGRLQRTNPEAAAVLAAQTRQHDFGRIYEGLTRPIGLRADDAGDVLTAYATLGYLIANNAPDPSPASVRGLRAQIGQRLASAPEFRSLTVRAKLGEELKVMFVTLHSGWQSARKEGNLRSYSDGASAMFRSQGTDLRALRLTQTGFSAR